MSNTFKSYPTASIGTGDVTVYTGPASTQAIVLGLTLANLQASQVTASVKFQSGATTIYLVNNAPIPAGGTLVVVGVDAKVVVEAADLIIVNCSIAAGVDALLSA